jgi:hypothetical protein
VVQRVTRPPDVKHDWTLSSGIGSTPNQEPIRRMSTLRTLAVTFAAILLAAAPAVAQQSETFATPTQTVLSATTGEAIFVEGEHVFRNVMVLKSEIRSTMPGSMMIPFSFTISPGDLVFRNSGREWEYFCADASKSTASFPGLGSVVEAGDCVGVRRRLSDGRLEWVVDNSRYNGFATVWSRRVRTNESAALAAVEQRQVMTDISVHRAVYFDGFYSGLLNFTFHDGDQRREMKFDYDGTSEKMIGMLGKRLVVLRADSVELRYRWVE